MENNGGFSGLCNKSITEMQYELNNLLIEDRCSDCAVSTKVLKLSQELDKLIVNHYTKKSKYKNLEKVSV